MATREIVALALGFALGVLTQITVEFLRRRLFDKPRLAIRTDINAADIADCPFPPGLVDSASPPSFHVNAVNTTDVPVILTAAFYTITYGDQAVGEIEAEAAGIRNRHDFPIRLGRHEAYKQSVDMVPWIKAFIDGRVAYYEDKSSLDYSMLRFDVSFLDTTERHWEGKLVCPDRAEARVLERAVREEYAPSPEVSTSA